MTHLTCLTPIDSRLFGRSIHALELLERETNPRLYAQGLYHLARRLEEAGRIEAAVFLYSALSPHPNPLPVAEEIREQAQARLAIMTGHADSLWDQAEFFGRRILETTFDIPTLTAMAVGGLAFHTFRFAGSRWFRAWLAPPTRRIAANIFGFSSELVAFSAAHRATSTWLHPNAFRPENFRDEIFAAALSLGPLRLAGGVSAFGALLAGQQLQEWAGYREHQSWQNFLADGLGTYLQFHLTGAIMSRLVGRPLRALESRLDRAAELSTSTPTLPLEDLTELLLAPAGLFLGMGLGGMGRLRPRRAAIPETSRQSLSPRQAQTFHRELQSIRRELEAIQRRLDLSARVFFKAICDAMEPVELAGFFQKNQYSLAEQIRQVRDLELRNGLFLAWQTLHHSDPPLRIEAARLFEIFPDRSGFLNHLLRKDGDPEVRRVAAAVMGAQKNHPNRRAYLLEAIEKDPDPEVRHLASRSLERWKVPPRSH